MKVERSSFALTTAKQLIGPTFGMSCAGHDTLLKRYAQTLRSTRSREEYIVEHFVERC